MATTIIPTSLHVVGTVTSDGTLQPSASSVTNSTVSSNAALARAKLEQNTVVPFVINLTDCRIYDAFHTNLPGAGATDDLGLIGGVSGTNSPTLQTGEARTLGSTNFKCRFLTKLPAEYDNGQTVEIRIHGGMKTTIADTSATVDVSCYESNKEEGISADLCTTSALSINSLTDADLDFTITATDLATGDVLDVLVTLNVNDAATGTAVIGMIGSIELLCDIKG